MRGRKVKSEPGIAAAPSEVSDPSTGRRSARLRLRAAWMYYVEEMTQSAIADALGVGRVTVVRLLNDARALHEVRISVSRNLAELPGLEFALQKAFGLKEAVVAPLSSAHADPSVPIGAAAGEYISKLLRNDMRIGLGWGKTLINALPFVSERPVANLSVVSLLGGITKTKQYNPSEFAWQFSRLFQADCSDRGSGARRRRRDEARAHRTLRLEGHSRFRARSRCGGGRRRRHVGGRHHLPFRLRRRARATIADRQGGGRRTLCHYFDRRGRLVDHPINETVMAVPIRILTKAKLRILASGGTHKTEAIFGAIEALRPTVFITDEMTAKALWEK